jgi:nitroreductase
VNVTDAILARRSCRAFTSQAVERDTIRQILHVARQSPSGGNLQPWHVHVLDGEPMKEFKALIAAKLLTEPNGEGSEYAIYPENLKDPYRARRFKCGEDLYRTIRVARDDRPARLAQFAKNYQFFGAPLAFFFSIDRAMGCDQWADVGMFMQNVMLLIEERGLHSCPQEAWAAWPRTLGSFLSLPPERMLFCGMAIGYRDDSAAVNRLLTDRAPVDEWLTWIGD